MRSLALLPRVELLQGLELLYEGLVLILEDRHPILETLDVLLLLVPALPGGLAVLHQPHLALPHRLLGVALRCSAAAADRDPRRTTTAAGTAGDYDLSVALEDILIFDVNKFNNLKIDEHELETFTSDWSWQLHDMTSDTQKLSNLFLFPSPVYGKDHRTYGMDHRF